MQAAYLPNISLGPTVSSERLSPPQSPTSSYSPFDGGANPLRIFSPNDHFQDERHGFLLGRDHKSSTEPDFDRSLGVEPSPLAASAPAHSVAMNAASTETLLPPDDASLSPAAMFLSAFSPIATAPVPLRDPDSKGEVISGFTLGDIIGHGGFSTIRQAVSSSGGTVAVKIVRKNDINKQPNARAVRKRLSYEASIWSSVSHEHILPLFSVTHTSFADYFFMLFCPAGSLFDILKRDGTPALPHDDAGMMFRQIVRGLMYLHTVAGLVHRDMKLENVLVDEGGVCRIGDFGMAIRIGENDSASQEDGRDNGGVFIEEDEDGEVIPRSALLSSKSNSQLRRDHPAHLSLVRRNIRARPRLSTMPSAPSPAPVLNLDNDIQPGSLPYASPELLKPHSTPLRAHPAQDMWALGCMLYAMLTGALPFRDSFEPRLQMKILRGTYDMPRDVGHGANEVIKGCLDASPANRWTIEMVDEIAWGVGWGNADVPTAEARPSSRGRQSSGDGERPSHSLVRPSLDASRRRSLSRSARSASRGPLAIQRSYSGASSSSTRPFSDDGSSYGDSVIYSPDGQRASSSSSERGRGRTTSQHRAHAHASLSWSRSPSKVPLTPEDHSAVILPKVADIEIHEFTEAEHRDAASPSLETFFTRGRKSSPRRIPGK